ncbi:uncharacterized protein A1O9_09964 [Exophiala aquamarina CBS 119918]|uniref:Uncharacterized protein n=1 Tax=Exophiala aquamarina CBS 119918 TaxID=1182545 RepID=A0A072P209_9EURO|nr:uncharacterized protein A1O9_09964 [Exophiala aquamarina CBS 119918]KEF54169.1 hypothetical protein A1O9_09964 [Exophiala aquamarina CBS 119918]
MADPRKPYLPRPKPLCNNNCGGVFDEDKRLGEITCPCGYGYYDFIKREFIEGSLVRSGRAPTKAEYQKHVQQCKHKMYGTPVVGFLGAISPNGTAMPYSSTATSMRNDAAPKDRNSIKVSKRGIEYEPLDYYLSEILKKSVRIEGEDDDDQTYYEIYGISSLAPDAHKHIVEDSRAWKSAATRRSSSGLAYKDSEIAKRRESISRGSHSSSRTAETFESPSAEMRQNAYSQQLQSQLYHYQPNSQTTSQYSGSASLSEADPLSGYANLSPYHPMAQGSTITTTQYMPHISQEPSLYTNPGYPYPGQSLGSAISTNPEVTRSSERSAVSRHGQLPTRTLNSISSTKTPQISSGGRVSETSINNLRSESQHRRTDSGIGGVQGGFAGQHSRNKGADDDNNDEDEAFSDEYEERNSKRPSSKKDSRQEPNGGRRRMQVKENRSDFPIPRRESKSSSYYDQDPNEPRGRNNKGERR